MEKEMDEADDKMRETEKKTQPLKRDKVCTIQGVATATEEKGEEKKKTEAVMEEAEEEAKEGRLKRFAGHVKAAQENSGHRSSGALRRSRPPRRWIPTPGPISHTDPGALTV